MPVFLSFLKGVFCCFYGAFTYIGILAISIVIFGNINRYIFYLVCLWLTIITLEHVESILSPPGSPINIKAGRSPIHLTTCWRVVTFYRSQHMIPSKKPLLRSCYINENGLKRIKRRHKKLVGEERQQVHATTNCVVKHQIAQKQNRRDACKV